MTRESRQGETEARTLTITPATLSPARLLAGRRVVVTRALEQADELSSRLRALGATPLHYSTIRIAPPADDYRALDEAVARLYQYDWIVFTSINAVEHFWARLTASGLGATALASARVAAIGPSTARAVEARGSRVAVVPDRYVAEQLFEALNSEDLAGRRFLLPRADIARPFLREALEAVGARVDEVEAYRTLVQAPGSEAEAALEGSVDYITFTSSSTARNFARHREGRSAIIPGGSRVAAIGPITARTARELGIHVDVIAEEHTIPGLVDAIVQDANTVRIGPYLFSPVAAADARVFARWRYEGPYQIYNPSGQVEEDVAYFMEHRGEIFTIREPDGEIVGYCSFGEDARVPGFKYDNTALDVGIQMRPDRTGQGRGGETLRTVLALAEQQFRPGRFRATIATWNARALNAADRAGFRPGVTFYNPFGMKFTVLLTAKRAQEEP